jgi:hypothetical protein
VTAYAKPEILRGIYPELSEGPRMTDILSITAQSRRSKSRRILIYKPLWTPVFTGVTIDLKTY